MRDRAGQPRSNLGVATLVGRLLHFNSSEVPLKPNLSCSILEKYT